MRKVAWWPEKEEGGVQLMAGPGLVYIVILGNAICSYATYLSMFLKRSMLLE